MNKELNAGTEVDSSKTTELLPSASLAQNPVLSVGLIVSIFAAAGYEFLEQSPKGEYSNRLLFYHHAGETNVQFWIDEENDLTKVMDFICQRAYDLGESWGKANVQTDIKKALGLLS
jgi:hypothetical protein